MAVSSFSPDSGAVPMGPAVLDHVAFGVRRIDEAAQAVMRRLGAQPYMSGPGIEFRGAQIRATGGGLIEFIEPDSGPDGFLARFLSMRGPGIHHVTFKVPKIEAARDALEASGYRVVGFSDAVPGWKEMFLHPKQALGVVVQIAEADPSLDDGWSDAWPYALAPSPQEPIAVRGFRLNALDAETARRQWGEVFGGHRKRHGNVDVFEWANSPLKIFVESDASLPEGPRGLEIEGEARASDEELAVLGHDYFLT